MLMVFNLDWKQFDIDAQVSEGNARMREWTRKSGIDVYFNLASMGAGEFMARMAWQGADRKPNDRILSFLRRMHWRVKRDLDKDMTFRANRETREMLTTLKRSGHDLMAVWAGASGEFETMLKNSRALDCFHEEMLVDYDHNGGKEDLTSVGLYRSAFKLAQAAPSEAIIVANTPEGVEEARMVKPLAVVGYVVSIRIGTARDAK